MDTYNLPDCFHGNTFDGVIFNFDDTKPELSLLGATAKMMVNSKWTTVTVDTLTISNSRLSLLSNFQLKILPFVVTYNPGVYQYDILITYASARKKTRISGEWIINEVITE